MTEIALSPWWVELDGRNWPFVDVRYELDGEEYQTVVGLFEMPDVGDWPMVERFDELFVMFYATERELVDMIGKKGEFAEGTLLEVLDGR